MGDDPPDNRRSAVVVPGPGVRGEPSALVYALKADIQDILAGLEDKADCQWAAAALFEPGASETDRTQRLAQVLQTIVAPVTAELATRYQKKCGELHLNAVQMRPLLDEHVETLADYFCSLLRTHAANFGEGALDESDLRAGEQALRRAIWDELADQLDGGGGAA